MVAAVTVTAMAQPAAACETDEPIKDPWGARLARYFETGDASVLAGHLSDDVTLIAFHAHYTDSGKLAYEGPADVTAALVAIRGFLVDKAWDAPRVFKAAKLSGQLEAGTTNELTVRFETEGEIRTSCGPTTSPRLISLLYESDYEPAEGSLLPALKRFAVLPPTAPVNWFQGGSRGSKKHSTQRLER
uniref:hypothetical protein n=1 Tax=uncultured Sphingomonas sp. TaxID=158754 RepID=UPI0025D07BA1|nr:hypothetical protein [uncultured Sphingomonas sp.]